MTADAPKRRVLFVDDEEDLLDGIRLTLRKERKRWEMLFACGGPEAVEILKREEVDAVITDMRMPIMDGAEVLAHARDLHPGACRLVLSGHADEALAMRALPVAHQYLNKPCDREKIVQAVNRTCSILELVHNPRIREVVGETTALPSTPRLYNSLIHLISSGEAGVDEVAAVVEMDPAMCAKFLQMANSAFFSLPRTIVEVRDAVALLGFRTVSEVVLAAEVFQSFGGPRKVRGLHMNQFQERSLLISKLVTSIAEETGLDAHSASSAGMLHDIGLLVLEMKVPDACRLVWKTAVEEGLPLHEAELRELQTHHAHVGAALLGMWGLPTQLVEAVMHHERPSESVTGVFDLAGAVHFAQYIVNTVQDELEDRTPEVPHYLDMEYLNETGLSSALSDWREVALRQASESGDAEAA